MKREAPITFTRKDEMLGYPMEISVPNATDTNIASATDLVFRNQKEMILRSYFPIVER
jgi:hypothetical protein